MNLDFISAPFHVRLHGFFGDVTDFDYAATGVPLLNALWDEVAQAKLAHKGVNHWAYPAADKVFVKIELEAGVSGSRLEPYEIAFGRYARHRHVGPYNLLGKAHEAMHGEIARQGLKMIRPAVEIYGHWQEDETKLKTDVLIPLEP